MNIKSIDDYGNIIRIGDKWLLFDIDTKSPEYQLFLDSVSTGALNKKNQTYHIFISHHSQIKDDLIRFIARATPLARKIVIHYPEWYRDYDIILPTCFFSFVGIKFKKMMKYKLQLERHPIYFSIEGDPDHKLRVSYTEDHFDASIVLHSVKKDLTGYQLSDGAISNYFRLNMPDMFRDRIIREFKKITPKGILEAFKTDDEIWDYIMQNGEWKIEGKKDKVNEDSGNTQ